MTLHTGLRANPTYMWILLASVMVSGWGFDLAFGGSSPAFRSVWATISLLTVVGGISAAYLERRRHEEDARNILDRLTREENERLLDDDESESSLSGANSSWNHTIGALRKALAEFKRRADDSDLARAGVEVRSRRIVGERDQLREMLENVTDPLIAIDPFEEIAFANPAAEKLFGLRRTVSGGFGPLRESLSDEAIVSALIDARKYRAFTTRNFEFTFTDAAGNVHPLRAACRPLKSFVDSAIDSRTAISGAIALFTDTSAQLALQKRNAEFVSSVSHEMKTPLSGIRAYVELLTDGDADDEETRAEFLGVIKSQAERLQRLVENLLNLARIEAGVVKVQKQARSLNEVLLEAANVLAPTAEMKQIKFRTELSPLYLGVFADRDTLLQAAINLGSNAVKYTPDGGEVILRSRLDDHKVVFEVQDSGVGLSEEDKYKVFEKFYRVKKDASMAPGTGLGLPLVKHIVEDIHGGSVEVESTLGMGSTFRVILPATDQIQR